MTEKTVHYLWFEAIVLASPADPSDQTNTREKQHFLLHDCETGGRGIYDDRHP
jgi:hypothetical protein